MHPKKMKEVYGTDKPRLHYVCSICKESTKADEWADDNSCINCVSEDTDKVENTYFLIDNHIK